MVLCVGPKPPGLSLSPPAWLLLSLFGSCLSSHVGGGISFVEPFPVFKLAIPIMFVKRMAAGSSPEIWELIKRNHETLWEREEYGK